jgi:asparagine N-glycosylation enzyme membrane subunit Stt3
MGLLVKYGSGSLIAVLWLRSNFDLAEHYPLLVYGVASLILLVGLAARFRVGRGKQT